MPATIRVKLGCNYRSGNYELEKGLIKNLPVAFTRICSPGCTRLVPRQCNHGGADWVGGDRPVLVLYRQAGGKQEGPGAKESR